MDDYMKMPEKEGKAIWTKKEESEDGSWVETKVEKVSNGYIKCVTTCCKKEGSWDYDTVKSIHEDNPMEEKSLVDKLEAFLKNR